MASIADALIATVFAPVCLSCARVLDAPTQSPVCRVCWARIGRFATPACDLGEHLPHLDRVHAIGPFEDVLRDVVHGLKFQQRRGLAVRLGPLLREAAGDLLTQADAVVPVPLHPWRQWRRGYNQADLLAETLGLPCWRVLRRRRATSPQTALDADARRANVRGAFGLGGWLPRAAARARPRVRARTLLLVDDVLTTGATLDACARMLKEAGAHEVHALTVARA
jgi:ComF family protein